MTKQDINDTIRKYMSESFLFDFNDQITPDSNLFEAGLIDSFGFVQLVAFIEEKFGTQLSEDDLASDQMASLNGIAAIVDRARAGAAANSGAGG